MLRSSLVRGKRNLFAPKHLPQLARLAAKANGYELKNNSFLTIICDDAGWRDEKSRPPFLCHHAASRCLTQNPRRLRAAS